MKTLNTNTKANKAFFNAYNRSNFYRLSDCYGKYSTCKAIAERDCIKMMLSENGEGFKILSFNTFGFTCGWKVENGLRVETPSNSYFVAD